MTLPTLSLGISPCPNDTFIFDALVHERIPAPFRYDLHMADVEELNLLARRGKLAVTKLSAAAVASVLDKYIVLNAGAALGRGCGPLLVSRTPLPSGALPEKVWKDAPIAIPGRLTTANLLLSLHGGFSGNRQEMVFDEVMPALEAGRADLGVIIHEGRFTYAERGLHLALDLGRWWEKHTGQALPLGLIAVRRDLGMETAQLVDDAVRRSLLYARTHPEAGRAFVEKNAQEMNPAVMAQHIATFVNDYSLDLGEEGRSAVRRLLEAAARESGMPLQDAPVFVS